MKTENSKLLLPVAAAAAPRGGEELVLPIQGLRTLLTSMILLLHWSSKSSLSGAPIEVEWWGKMTRDGMNIVLFFFLISGFVTQLPGRSAPSGGRGRALFVLSRALRLAPMYWAGTLLSLAVKLGSGGCVPYLALLNVFALQSWAPVYATPTPCDEPPATFLIPMKTLNGPT